MSKKFLLTTSAALALGLSVSTAQSQDLGLPDSDSPLILPGVAIAGFIGIAAGVIGGSGGGGAGGAGGGATVSTTGN